MWKYEMQIALKNMIFKILDALLFWLVNYAIKVIISLKYMDYLKLEQNRIRQESISFIIRSACVQMDTYIL